MNLPEGIRLALRGYDGDWANIDQLLQFVKPQIEEAAIEGHIDTLLKVEVRHAVKSLKDEDGEPQFENVLVKGKDGKTEKRYKRVARFLFDDFVDCVNSYTSRAHGQMRRANELAKRCKRDTGRAIPLPFPDFDRVSA